jgi:hypothetical protein
MRQAYIRPIGTRIANMLVSVFIFLVLMWNRERQFRAVKV